GNEANRVLRADRTTTAQTLGLPNLGIRCAVNSKPFLCQEKSHACIPFRFFVSGTAQRPPAIRRSDQGRGSVHLCRRPTPKPFRTLSLHPHGGGTDGTTERGF